MILLTMLVEALIVLQYKVVANHQQMDKPGWIGYGQMPERIETFCVGGIWLAATNITGRIDSF